MGSDVGHPVGQPRPRDIPTFWFGLTAGHRKPQLYAHLLHPFGFLLFVNSIVPSFTSSNPRPGFRPIARTVPDLAVQPRSLLTPRSHIQLRASRTSCTDRLKANSQPIKLEVARTKGREDARPSTCSGSFFEAGAYNWLSNTMMINAMA